MFPPTQPLALFLVTGNGVNGLNAHIKGSADVKMEGFNVKQQQELFGSHELWL